MARQKVKIDLEARNRTKRAFDEVDKSVKGLTRSSKALQTSLAGIGGTAIFAALDRFGQAALQNNRIFTEFADRLGASAGALSEFAVAGDIAGVTIQQTSLAVQRATRRIAEAAAGYGEARDALASLNIEASQLTVLTADEQFRVLADALGEVTNQSDRLRLAFKLFDSEGTAVLQLLDEFNEARRVAQETGAVITDEEVRDLEDFRRATAETSASWRSLEQAFISSGIPRTLETIKQAAITFAEVLVDSFSTVGKLIGAVGASLASVFRGDLEGAKEVARAFAEDFNDLWGDQSGAVANINATTEAIKPFTIEIKEAAGFTKELADEWKIAFDLIDAEFRELDVAAAKAFLGIAESTEEVTEEMRRAQRFADSLASSMTSAFEEAIFSGDSLRDVIAGLIQDVATLIIRMQILQPLAQALSGFFGGGGGTATAAGVRGFALGTNFAPGGLAMVGERGPELVNLPRGSQVIPNSRVAGVNVVVNNNVERADVQVEEQPDGSVLINFVEQAVARSISGNGLVGQAITGSFGNQLQGVTR